MLGFFTHFLKLKKPLNCFFFFFRENFERAYIEATEQFYNVKAPQQLALEADGAGVFGYMKWAEAKLREEEQRALKYLETTTGKSVISLFNKFSVINYILYFNHLNHFVEDVPRHSEWALGQKLFLIKLDNDIAGNTTTDDIVLKLTEIQKSM